jgi:predicted DsbA family dithiol-disulfide isomerase
MSKTLHIDFVSDVVCPWCVVGLGGRETALGRLEAEGIGANIHFQPFELNPRMAPEGENVVEHIGRKYGSTPEQSAANRAMITDRAAEAWADIPGAAFEMRMTDQSRIWNTFDAHRLIHWAGAPVEEGGPTGEDGKGVEGAQAALKYALFRKHFTDNHPLAQHEVLAGAAVNAGLDRDAAMAVLTSGRYGDEVRAAEALWRSRGVNSVPAVIVEGRYLISGGQPAEVFEEALRTIAAEA